MSRNPQPAIVIEGSTNVTIENVETDGPIVSFAGQAHVIAQCRACGYQQELHGEDMTITDLNCPRCSSKDIRLTASSSGP